MKKFLIGFIVLVASGLAAQAGVIGFLTARDVSWETVQAVGGLRLGGMVKNGGKDCLVIQCDLSGLTAITRKPTQLNSGIVVRKIKVRVRKDELAITLVSQAAEGSSRSAGPTHYCDVSRIPPGKYKVYYGEFGEPGRYLGEVER